jgi:hypothetical protein
LLKLLFQNLSASHRSASRHSQTDLTGATPVSHKGTPVLGTHMDLGSVADIDQMLTSSDSSHPLRILSMENVKRQMHCERSTTCEDVALSELDQISLAATDNDDGAGDDDDMDEEELELAMAASMSSVRSHDVLVRLRSDNRQLADAREREERDLLNFQLHWPPTTTALDTARNDDMSPALRLRQKMHDLVPKQLVCCSMAQSTMSVKSINPPAAAIQPISVKQTDQVVPLATRETSSSCSTPRRASHDSATTENHNHTSGSKYQSVSQNNSPRHSLANVGNSSRTASRLPSLTPAEVVLPVESRLPVKPGWRPGKIPKPAKVDGQRPSTSADEKSSPKLRSIKSESTKAVNGRIPVNTVITPRQSTGSVTTSRPALNSTSQQTTPSKLSTKRSSSGYDSGHDSAGGAMGPSPDPPATTSVGSKLTLPSPYSKITPPRPRPGSSGHGSDSSTGVGGEGQQQSVKTRLGHLLSGRHRESYSASSGYESNRGESDGYAPVPLAPARPTEASSSGGGAWASWTRAFGKPACTLDL